MAGVIVLERCTVESEAFSGNRNAFRLGECLAPSHLVLAAKR